MVKLTVQELESYNISSVHLTIVRFNIILMSLKNNRFIKKSEALALEEMLRRKYCCYTVECLKIWDFYQKVCLRKLGRGNFNDQF
jgi:hypothetical protein